VAGCCEYSDEPVVFDAMELVIGVVDYECLQLVQCSEVLARSEMDNCILKTKAKMSLGIIEYHAIKM
jgi:hypothetical protein